MGVMVEFFSPPPPQKKRTPPPKKIRSEGGFKFNPQTFQVHLEASRSVSASNSYLCICLFTPYCTSHLYKSLDPLFLVQILRYIIIIIIRY